MFADPRHPAGQPPSRGTGGASGCRLRRWRVLWLYLVLTFGLLADPGSLPPLTRDLDVLTVPLVSAGSVLAISAFVLSALALRRHGWRPVATAIAVLLVVADLVISASSW